MKYSSLRSKQIITRCKPISQQYFSWNLAHKHASTRLRIILLAALPLFNALSRHKDLMEAKSKQPTCPIIQGIHREVELASQIPSIGTQVAFICIAATEYVF
jgi:hypothetical protein